MHDEVTDNRRRALSLTTEVIVANEFLILAIRSIASRSGERTFFHIPLLLLSFGVERLLKCCICLEVKHRTGKYPVGEPWNKKNGQGHNIRKLHVQALSGFKTSPPNWGASDRAFLEQDAELALMLDALTQYASASRYFDLDKVVGRQPTEDSRLTYQDLENLIGQRLYGAKFHALLADISQHDACIAAVNMELQRLIERYARAIARFLIWGEYQKTIPGLGLQIDPFYKLNDDQLGVTTY